MPQRRSNERQVKYSLCIILEILQRLQILFSVAIEHDVFKLTLLRTYSNYESKMQDI